ncbi:hypothetical protein [Rhodococcus spongiicola]|uniref:Uncharacterized protein n=1 Tax=Rhodococcus spongiicola TaxID=2487352 RepID=A0A438APS3_9NOCA|nr:hypothetical protein [Rhodococcus spongiicola]RVW00481.1 hypothetical protein EF834_17750 [Rhodococcus spongiicola]
MKSGRINRRAWIALLTLGLVLMLGLVTACSAEEPVNPYSDASAAVFSRNGDTGPRDLPEVPELPTSTVPGARFTLDGLWSGTAVTDDPADLSCGYDTRDKRWTYSVTTEAMKQFSGVDNYPTEDFYALQVVVSDNPQFEGEVEWTAQAVVLFADSTGTYVRMAAPDPDSIVAYANEDRSAVAFSMINAAEDDRGRGSPTTVVGTITCPAP